MTIRAVKNNVVIRIRLMDTSPRGMHTQHRGNIHDIRDRVASFTLRDEQRNREIFAEERTPVSETFSQTVPFMPHRCAWSGKSALSACGACRVRHGAAPPSSW